MKRMFALVCFSLAGMVLNTSSVFAQGAVQCTGFHGNPNRLPYQKDGRVWKPLSVNLWFDLSGEKCGSSFALIRSYHKFMVRVSHNADPEFLFIQIHPATILLQSNYFTKPYHVRKGPFEHVTSSVERSRQQKSDDVIEREFTLGLTVNEIHFDVYLSVRQRTDRNVMISKASYKRRAVNLRNPQFNSTGGAQVAGFSGEDVLSLPPPKSIQDLHAAYRNFTAIVDPLKRPAYSSEAGGWVPVCHRNHPYRRSACQKFVCGSSRPYVRRHCELISAGMPRDHVAPKSHRENTQAKSRISTILRATPTFGEPIFNPRLKRWIDVCDPDHPKYFHRCSYVRQFMVSRIAFECVSRQKSRKPREWAGLTPGEIGAFVLAMALRRFISADILSKSPSCRKVIAPFEK